MSKGLPYSFNKTFSQSVIVTSYHFRFAQPWAVHKKHLCAIYHCIRILSRHFVILFTQHSLLLNQTIWLLLAYIFQQSLQTEAWITISQNGSEMILMTSKNSISQKYLAFSLYVYGPYDHQKAFQLWMIRELYSFVNKKKQLYEKFLSCTFLQLSSYTMLWDVLSQDTV